MTDREREQAIKEAHNIAASEAYFAARVGFGYPQPLAVFDAGFSRGWDAGRAPLLERIAELEAKVEQGKNIVRDDMKRLAERDARIAELEADHIDELLRQHVIRLNRENKSLEAKLAQQAEAQEPFAWAHVCRKKPELRALSFSKNEPTMASLGYKAEPLFTRPQPAQLTAGDDRSHVICLCPDCIKPKDAPTAVQGEQP